MGLMPNIPVQIFFVQNLRKHAWDITLFSPIKTMAQKQVLNFMFVVITLDRKLFVW